MSRTPFDHYDNDERDEDEDATQLNVGDPITRKTRRLSRQCDTCIFRAGNLMHLDRGRLKDIVGEAIATDKYIICHETLPGMSSAAVAPAICRGFHDRYTTSALRIMARLWGFVDIDPPGKDKG